MKPTPAKKEAPKSVAQTKSDPISGSLGHMTPDYKDFLTEDQKLELRLRGMKPREFTTDEEHDDTQDSIAWA